MIRRGKLERPLERIPHVSRKSLGLGSVKGGAGVRLGVERIGTNTESCRLWYMPVDYMPMWPGPTRTL
jgi:hypothetical protein